MSLFFTAKQSLTFFAFYIRQKSLRAHPNIVHFVEASASALRGGGYEIFILMEYCSGGGIIDLMNARLRTRLTEAEVLKIFGDVAAGLHVMHSMDPPIMHRDLKVENILLSPPSRSNPGAGPTYKLCDFGSAKTLLSRKPALSLEEVKRLEADLNKSTTLQYRAPEMVDVYQRRAIDEKSDIWAMGVLLYKLCYYTTPFEENGGGPLAILNAQYRFPHMPPYSQRLKDLIALMLQEQSSARPSIEEVIVRVHRILGTTPPSFLLKASQAAAANGSHMSSSVLSTVVPQLPRRNSGVTTSAGGTTDDLIALGPSKAEQKRAENEDLKKRSEGITPMRRGRPNKPAGQTETPSRAAIGALRPPSASPPRAQPRAAAPASPVDGFADSFVPSIKSNGSRPPSALDHSPALPGFEAAARTSNPRLSPLPPPLASSPKSIPLTRSSTIDSQAQKKVDKGAHEQDATSRFPSVEELDIRYPTARQGSKPTAAVNRTPTAASGPPPSTSAVVVVPGLASRDSVSAMAGKFGRANTIASAAAPPSTSGSAALTHRNDGTGPSSKGASGVATAVQRLSSERWPHSDAGATKEEKTPSEQRAIPSLPARRQVHKDWLQPSYGQASNASRSGASQEEKDIDPPAHRNLNATSTIEVSKERNRADPGSADDSSADEDTGPEDLDTPPPARISSAIPNLANERRDDSLKPRPAANLQRPLSSEPGKVQPPTWLQSTQHVQNPEIALPNSGAQAATSDVASRGSMQGAMQKALSSPSPADVVSGGGQQGATAPAWDEDDEEMHFLPQPTLGTTHEAEAMPAVAPNAAKAKESAQLVDVDEVEEAHSMASNAAAIPPVKRYADASTSPHRNYQDLPSEQPSTAVSTPAAQIERPVVAPKPSRFTSSKEVGGLVDRFETTSIADPSSEGGSAKTLQRSQHLDERRSSIDSRRMAFEASGDSTRSAAAIKSPQVEPGASPAGVAGKPSAKRQSTLNGSRKPPPPAAAKPASAAQFSRKGRVGLKPWEREAMEKEEVQKYGALRKETAQTAGGDADDPSRPEAVESEAFAAQDDASQAPTNTVVSQNSAGNKAPGEAQERFRGVSSLISQWQANASRGAPGWGTVGGPSDGAYGPSDSESKEPPVLSAKAGHRASAIVGDDAASLARTASMGRRPGPGAGGQVRERLASREV